MKIPRPVWLLGWVSLATDAATEAIYPLLPFFLTQVLGATATSLGVVEGAAEAVNSILKIWAGRVADHSRSKRRLVLIGYSVSSFARPFIALAQSWTQVFAIRVLDRVGKGVRGAPRDAMLASYATPAARGKIFGFHRAMDHTGAIIGPTLASLFLYVYPGEYRTLFALTAIPGAIAVALIFVIKEPEIGTDPAVRLKPDTTSGSPDVVSGFSRTVPSSTEPLPREFRNFMLVLSLFTLGNSTDAFLLLRLTDVAGSAKWIPLMWAALHVVKATVSVAAGSWSDRVGRRTVIAIGWGIYAAVYAGFAFSRALVPLLVWFMVYGLYFGFAEGTEKALVADLAPAERRGFAFGVFNAVQGLGALTASVMFGLLWKMSGAPAAFGVGAALALASTLLLFAVVRPARS